MAGKRLFLSACEMVHKEMASQIIPATHCVSIVGPRDVIRFTEAAVLWPTVYHLMFSEADRTMSHSVLNDNLQKVSDLFGVKLGYFSRSKKLKRGYTLDLLQK